MNLQRKNICLLLVVPLLCICCIFIIYIRDKRAIKPIETCISEEDLYKKATFDLQGIDNRIDSLQIKYNIPAIAIAIVRKDKLVYINCYGVQDVKNHILTQNSSLFRIASISKPITLVALLKLMQEGRLRMNDKVFGRGSILEDDFGVLSPDSDWSEITVRHLIEHTSGIQNQPNDPMFYNKGLTNKEIIRQVVQKCSLASKPGESYYYSNVGYSILGRVIEKVSGMNYEDYVKSNILNPCGITRMTLAKNTLEECFEDEVKYVQPNDADRVYTMDVHRMDAHGGWIASATDLARFIVHVDRVEITPDIVEEKWLDQTYLGFERWVHTGSLPGTSAMLTRMNDEFSYVFLANSRSLDKDFWEDISKCMESSIQECEYWPDINLFENINW